MWTGHVSYPEARRRLATRWAVRAADPVRGHPGRPSAALGRPSVGTSGQPSQLGEARAPGETDLSLMPFWSGCPKPGLRPREERGRVRLDFWLSLLGVLSSYWAEPRSDAELSGEGRDSLLGQLLLLEHHRLSSPPLASNPPSPPAKLC